ncbi:hypothetical protein I6I98_00675 [Sphingobacterium multivorum]|jgi:hypothetical protein|uniref:Plasmid pRiA4b Orf3-like domain-containing protein n=1 Tax=Sphingobacterium multivorum TaxID=28454 RepID=A0ABX7CP28_SPHMU|nr:hypothetical protein [Sphingobacterium multivorum]QQT53823.1 hypothetical protein I6I98_00675 [Sphingobacterium multivorum]
MAIYRFRVTFEDYEDVYREIDMPSKSTFIDLHEEIHKSTGYAADASSSFYVSNDQWKKGTEIAFKPTQRKKDAEVLLMENIRLSKFIDDPHQKFYYVYNFDRPYDFQVELIKILKEEDGKDYPALFKSMGQVPKTMTAANFPVSDAVEEDDYVEEDDTQYGVDDDDELDGFDSDGDDEEEGEEGEEREESNGYEDEY